jgi:hypothetical protein
MGGDGEEAGAVAWAWNERPQHQVVDVARAGQAAVAVLARLKTGEFEATVTNFG